MQHGAGQYDHRGGYMTVLVINHGIIKAIGILRVVIHLMMKFDVDKPRECFRQEVKWTLAIR